MLLETPRRRPVRLVLLLVALAATAGTAVAGGLRAGAPPAIAITTAPADRHVM